MALVLMIFRVIALIRTNVELLIIVFLHDTFAFSWEYDGNNFFVKFIKNLCNISERMLTVRTVNLFFGMSASNQAECS